MNKRETGTIKWFDNKKGFGFIKHDRGGDIFVHYSAIYDKEYCSLDIGSRVDFIIIKSDKGPQAQDVRCLVAQDNT